MGSTDFLTGAQIATIVDNTTSTTLIYIGKAEIGTATSAALWTIMRIDTTNGALIAWANSGTDDQIWDNRASLTYT